MAFRAIRNSSAAGTISSAQRCSCRNTSAAPVASDRSIAATVTWFAVTPAFASDLHAGLNSPWKAGLIS